ncbi:MAG: hypothetical protein PHP22_08685, partial [Oscillospiraceae bacterium]|nr:hypothetical protein [Oscillospiraceae bacterium]
VRYAITEKGRMEYEAWLLEETVQQPARSEFMLKLLFSSSLPRQKVVGMLEDYKTLHEKNVGKYRAMQKDLEQSKSIAPERVPFLNAVLRRGILSGEAVIRWCDETIGDLG